MANLNSLVPSCENDRNIINIRVVFRLIKKYAIDHRVFDWCEYNPNVNNVPIIFIQWDQRI